jgi:hypothetical protein
MMSRNQQKYHFYKKFRLEDIILLYRARFIALFDDACFKCGQLGPLQIDHHVPYSRGGSFEEGNLVLLCKECNEEKKERMPEQFYTPSDLRRLAPLLEAQKKLFEFKWDWGFWKRDRAGYLASVGLDGETIHKILYDKNYPYYIGLEEQEQPMATINLNINPDGSLSVVTLHSPDLPPSD